MSSEMIDLILDDASERMEKAIAHTRQEFASIRTGRDGRGGLKLAGNAPDIATTRSTVRVG